VGCDRHSRGVSATFSDQITPQHLLTLQGSYATATSLRYNNSGIGHTNGPVGYLVNGNDPYSGVCYTLTGTPVVGCNQAGTPGKAPGNAIQPILAVPYAANGTPSGLATFPFTMYFEARVKI
jgi:hypothetical protein